MTDYKGVQFSFESKRRHEKLRLYRRAGLVLLLLALTVLTLLWRQGVGLHKRVSDLLSEQLSPAAFRQSLPAYRFFPRARAEAIALSWCLEDCAKGQQLLNQISRRSPFFKADSLLSHLIEKASPLPFISYAEFLEKHDNLPPFYTILLRHAKYQSVAEAELKRGLDMAPASEGMDQIRARIQKQNRELAKGEVVVVRDRENRPLASWSPKEGTLSEALPGFSLRPLVPLFAKGYRQIRLSLSLDLQQYTHKQFHAHFGSLVLIDLETGAILTAYSKPRHKDNLPNSAFSERYEPGSIIKLLTLFFYSEQKRAFTFPYQCKGNMIIDDRLFYDWMPHGRIESIQEAMALSCNLVFAGMGTELGADALVKGLGEFYFNRPRGLEDGPFSFSLGRTATPRNQYDLANLSIGLEEIETSTVHAAIISGLIAGNGILPHPHLMASSSNILGLVIGEGGKAPLEIHPRGISYLVLQQSMILAVDHPQGTARRGVNDRFPFAAKTGTAGNRKNGLDAIIIAYFPRHSPRYALAFRLEGGGKAEYTGAIFLSRYLAGFPD